MGISRLFQTLAELLPPWLYYATVAVLIVLAIPGLKYSIKGRQIRGALRRVSSLTSRVMVDEQIARAFERAGENPRLLTLLCEEAIRLKQFEIWPRALARMKEVGVPSEHARLLAMVMPEQQIDSHPLQAAIAVRRLRDEGMDQAADERLHRAIERFGPDEELMALLRE